MQTVGENGDARAMAGGPQQCHVDRVALSSLHWFVLAALVCRVALTIPAAILNRSVLGEWGDRLLPLIIGVLLLDGLLIIGALRRPGVIGSWWLFAADMTVTMLVTVVATLLIAPGTFLVAGRDAMTGYGWGTVALWTALRGWRTGAALLCATPLVQVAMAALNDAPLDAAGSASLIARTAIAAINFAVTLVIVTLADRGAHAAASAGLEAGRLAARADALRRYHDTALAELDAMVLQAAQQSRPVRQRLATITARARHLASEWRVASVPVPADDLTTALADLRLELAGRGLRVALVGGVPCGALHGRVEVVAAVVGAVREALNNVAKHTEAEEAVVAVAADAEWIKVDIRDDGPGFATSAIPGFGLRHSIVGRIRDIGGDVAVHTGPRRGTVIRLTVPTRSLPPPGLAGVASSAVLWFPLVPLLYRLLALPLIDFFVRPYLPEQEPVLDAALGTLFVAHVFALAALTRRRQSRLVHSPLVLVIDLAIATCLVLWFATAEASGQVVLPGADGAWLYILGTVPFWIAVRGGRVGAAVLAYAIVLEGVAVFVNHAFDSPLLVIQHVVMVLVTAGYGALIMNRARRGTAAALGAAVAVGEQAEQVGVLTTLHGRVLSAWDAIAAAPTTSDPATRLADVARTAGAAACALRAALRSGVSADNGLAATLTALAAEMRQVGLRVEVVVTELDGDPPPAVLDAAVSAVRATLVDLAENEPGTLAVVRVSWSAEGLDVRVRGGSGCHSCPASIAAMAAVGGRALTHATPSGGTRTSLQWSAA